MAVRALTNPYTPDAGAEPEAVIGRDTLLERFDLLLGRLTCGRTEQSMIVTGLRGVGKTVLLGQFRTQAPRQDWGVVELEVSKQDDTQLRRTVAGRIRTALLELSPRVRWGARLHHAAAVLTSFTTGVDAAGTWSAGLDVEAAEERQRGVVLPLDEVQFLSEVQLEALIEALHETVQRKLPLTMVGAGLPQIAELAGDAKSCAERLLTFPEIGVLAADDAKAALARPAEDEGVTYSAEAQDEPLATTGGYPYVIQELGYAVWTVAAGPEVTRDDVLAAVPAYEAELDASLFRVRLDRTTDLQCAHLRATAELGPDAQKASDVADVRGRTSTNLGPTRAELIDTGLLWTPQHGCAAFTVPHCDRFLLRVIPVLQVPERRPRRPRPETS